MNTNERMLAAYNEVQLAKAALDTAQVKLERALQNLSDALNGEAR